VGDSGYGDIRIYLNQTAATGHYAFVYPRMDAPNVYAVGAYLEFYAAGEAGTAGAHPFLRAKPNPNAVPIHVGLGAYTSFDVAVVWPTGTVTELYHNLNAADSIEIRPGGVVNVEQKLQKEVGVEGSGILSASPNPFNPATTITYIVPRTTYGVKMQIYNTRGELVTTLVSEKQGPGTYRVNWNARGVSSGVYLAQMWIGNRQAASQRIMLIK
jgi:hypothetical protein